MSPVPRTKRPFDTSPVVVIDVPEIVAVPPPIAPTPKASNPVVLTEPPLSVTTPLVSACTPSALTPDVAIVVPFEVVMLDPAPLDWSPARNLRKWSPTRR